MMLIFAMAMVSIFGMFLYMILQDRREQKHNQDIQSINALVKKKHRDSERYLREKYLNQ